MPMFYYYQPSVLSTIVQAISVAILVGSYFILTSKKFSDKSWRVFVVSALSIFSGVIFAFSFYDALYVQYTATDASKPAIYLYPESEQVVDVDVDIVDGYFVSTVPEAPEGKWHVLAHEDGSIDDLIGGGKDYGYLFWDAKLKNVSWDETHGFCVSKEDIGTFFKNILPQLGLSDRECHDFESYWISRLALDGHDWFLISFQTDEYTDRAQLSVSPEPDSLIRVFMVARGLDAPVDIEEPDIETPSRNGFTVVEWGGSLV